MAERNRRLDSWKAIADYLGRDVRTVIRWEKEKGLPVRRGQGAKRTSVFANSEEINAWMLSGAIAPDEPESTVPPAGFPEPHPGAASGDAPARRPHGWRLRLGSKRAFALAAAALMVFAAGLWLAWPRLLASSTGEKRPLQFIRADYAAEAPRGLVAGDFDRDGRLDLAFTNSDSDTVAVLLGDGFGVFPKRIVTRTSLGSPERLVTDDFDGDGKLDLAVTSFDTGSQVEVLLGRGDGSFQSKARFDVGGRARWISAGDLNRDGKVDLIIAASFVARIIVLLGNGDGSFREAGRYEAETDVSALALVDVNRDGFPDVIATDYRMATASSVSLFLNDGKGGLRPRQTFATGRGPLGLAVGDLNQDGLPDLVTANFPLEGSILFGTSSAGFAKPLNFSAGRGNGFVLVADLDLDGFQDLLVLGEHSNTCSLFFGDGRGTFLETQKFTTARYPDAAVVGDFDRDQRPDIAIAGIEGDAVSTFLNRTPAQSPQWWARLWLPAAPHK